MLIRYLHAVASVPESMKAVFADKAPVKTYFWPQVAVPIYTSVEERHALRGKQTHRISGGRSFVTCALNSNIPTAG